MSESLYYKKVNKKFILNLGLFVINPMSGFLYSVVVRGFTKSSPFFIAFFYAIFAYNLVPTETMDLATHYKLIPTLQTLTYTEIFDLKTNVLLNFYMKFISELGIRHQFIPFSITFFSFYLVLTLFIRCTGLERTEIILILTAISFMSIANGLRFGLSVILFIAALIYFNELSKAKGGLFLLFSIITHSFILLPVFIYLVTSIIYRFISNDSFYKYLSVFLIILSIFSPITIFFNYIYPLIPAPPEVDALVATYIHGDKWGVNATFEGESKVVQMFQFLPFFGASLVYFFSDKQINRHTAFIYILISIPFLTISSWQLSARYQYLVTMVITVWFIYFKNSGREKYILIACNLIWVIWSLVKFRYVLFETINFIYLPLPLSFIYELDGFIVN